MKPSPRAAPGRIPVKGTPEVIFFDAAGTLIRLARPVGWHYAETAREHGLPVEEHRLEDAFRAVWKSLPRRPPQPAPREDDDRPWWRRVALETLRRAASPPATFDDAAWFESLYDRFARPGVWLLHEDVLPCLNHLAGRARLAVLSNFDGRLRPILSDLGVSGRFEHLFISSEIGAEKPSIAIFQRALETMKAEPSDCLHVGDDEENDEAGARAAGLSTLLVRRPGTTLHQVAQLCV